MSGISRFFSVFRKAPPSARGEVNIPELFKNSLSNSNGALRVNFPDLKGAPIKSQLSTRCEVI